MTYMKVYVTFKRIVIVVKSFTPDKTIKQTGLD